MSPALFLGVPVRAITCPRSMDRVLGEISRVATVLSGVVLLLLLPPQPGNMATDKRMRVYRQ